MTSKIIELNIFFLYLLIDFHAIFSNVSAFLLENGSPETYTTTGYCRFINMLDHVIEANLISQNWGGLFTNLVVVTFAVTVTATKWWQLLPWMVTKVIISKRKKLHSLTEKKSLCSDSY